MIIIKTINFFGFNDLVVISSNKSLGFAGCLVFLEWFALMENVMSNIGNDLKRELQEAAKREKRLRIKIALSIIVIIGVLIWLL